MFAIAFDMVVRDITRFHPRGIPQAYSEVAATLERFGFSRVQGSVYLSGEEDFVSLFRAIEALKSIEWFRRCVRDIRAFRVEQRSDFTSFIKE